MGYTKVKFKEGGSSPFFDDLNTNVEQYFLTAKLSRFANLEMILKTCIITIAYFGLYLLIITNQFNDFRAILLCIALGLIHPLFFINIGHDAMHNTYSKSNKVNQWISYMLNFIGLNTYINRFLHLRVHHAYTSIEGLDVVVEEYSILRLSENQPYSSYHKYQKYYAVLVYSLFSLFLIFETDFKLFKRVRMGNLMPVKHPKSEWVKLYLLKLFYLIFSLVIPLVFVKQPWYAIVGGFFLVHCISGLVLAIVGLLNHQINESVFPMPNSVGYIMNNKKDHEIEVTIDFAPYSKFALWYFGGFNTHVAHHLFPQICHVHYIPITRIIEDTASKYGLVYQKKSFFGAIKSHFQYLERLGRPCIDESIKAG